MNKIKLSTISATMLLVMLTSTFFVIAPPVNAQVDTTASNYKVLAPLPCIESPDKTATINGVTQTVPGIKCPNGNGAVQAEVNFKTYVQYTFNLLIALAAVAAVAMIVIGGIEYMTTGSFQGKAEGRQRITNAIYGLLLVLCSYLILKTIDPRFVQIPTTLVPQIVLNPDLTKNMSGIMMSQLEAEANQYRINRVELLAIQKQTSDKLDTERTKLDAVNEKLEKYGIASDGMQSVNDQEYKDLLLEKERIENNIQDIRVDYTNQITNTAMNQSQLYTAAELANPNTSTQEKVKSLEENKKVIEGIEKTTDSTLSKLGEKDTSKTTSDKTYYTSKISLSKVELITRQIDLEKVHTFKGTIVVPTLDGNRSIEMKPAEAKEMLLGEIRRVYGDVGYIMDPKQKEETSARIKTAKDAIEKKFGK